MNRAGWPETSVRFYSTIAVSTVTAARFLSVKKPTSCHDSLFFTNLMHKFFIWIHLLHSCTCFEHYCAHLQGDNFVNARPLVVCVLNSHSKRVTIPEAVLIQLSSWRWAHWCLKHVQECNKCIKIKNLSIKLVKKTIIILGHTVNKT